jgi:hypothetical protein
VQAHGALRHALVTPQRPCHPRQSAKQAAVHDQRLPLRRLDPTQSVAAPRRFGPQFFDHLLQNLRRKDSLRLAKAAQAHVSATDLALHPPQFGGLAQPAHGAHHRIEQPEEQQRKIISAQKPAPRIALAARHRHPLYCLGQTRPKILNQLPARQIALAQWLG